MKQTQLLEKFELLSKWMINILFHDLGFSGNILHYLDYNESDEECYFCNIEYYTHLIKDKLTDVWLIYEAKNKLKNMYPEFDFEIIEEEENVRFCTECLIEAFQDILKGTNWHLTRDGESWKNFEDFYKELIVWLYFLEKEQKQCKNN